MRKMFSRLFTVLILLVFTMAVNASPSPPDDVGKDYTKVVVTPDVANFVINQIAIDAEVYNYSAPKLATEETLYTEVQFDIIVREVAYSRKISLRKAESGAATENAVMAINSACTDLNNDLKGPPLLITTIAATNKNYRRNLQHNNFGYPLSAN